MTIFKVMFFWSAVACTIYECVTRGWHMALTYTLSLIGCVLIFNYLTGTFQALRRRNHQMLYAYVLGACCTCYVWWWNGWRAALVYTVVMSVLSGFYQLGLGIYGSWRRSKAMQPS